MIIFAGAGGGGIILPQRPCPGVSGSKDKFVETPPSVGTHRERIRATQGSRLLDS